jgi:exonuclease SbcD
MIASKFKNSLIYKRSQTFNRDAFKGIILGYFCDSHLRFQNPTYRKDKFKETVENKLNDIGHFISEYKVDGVIHGGDLFDSPTIDEATWVHFGSKLQHFGVPIYAIPGNHDMEGHNPITLPSSPIFHLAKLGVLNLITDNKDNPIIINKNGVSVQITGRGFHGLMDQKEKEHDYVLTSKKADYAIHMVHGNLLTKPSNLPNFHYTLVEEISHTMADLTLGAHYHAGFPFTVVEDDGFEKYFFNPKAMVRKSKSEMKNMPVFTLIYISEDGIYVETIPLPSAKPAIEVLDLVRIEQEENSKKNIEDLVMDIRSKASITKRVNMREILNDIGSQTDVPQPVKDTAMGFIMEAQKQLKKGGLSADEEDNISDI